MNRMLRWACAFVFLIASAHQASGQMSRKAPTDTSRFAPPYQVQSTNPFSESSRVLITQGSDASMQPAVQSGVSLAPFGFDLFTRERGDVLEFSSESMALPGEYTLGPGDRLGIYLLGNVQQTLDVVVNVEGKVFVPPAGVLYVWGLDLAEVERSLENKLSQYYDNFHLDIMLLQPKNVTVSVVGDVRRPGRYLLSALNTVLDAIIVAGGPTSKGSIRDIQLIRDESVFASVDLYQFLMSGAGTEDVFLQAGDRVFVPVAHDKVSIRGEVHRPAIFELKPGQRERLSDLIELAGGFTDLAFESKIEVTRMRADGGAAVVYPDFSAIAQGDSALDLVLRNHDAVTVYSKIEQLHKRQVSIYGEIRRPGTYDLADNMHLEDLILKAGNLTRKAYTLEAEVAKVDPGQPTRFQKVSLQEQLGGNGHSNPLLEEDDQVFIRQIPEWQVGLLVQVDGEVLFPGAYPIEKDKTSLSEILTKAGGFTDDAFLQEARLIRESSRLRFDKEFERLQDMGREDMTELEYQYLVMRQNSADVKQIVVNFGRLMREGDRSEDVILEDGDVIVIPKAPRIVTVTGSVAKPGGVTYLPGAKLEYYLARSGGASWDAELRKTKVIKVSGEVVDDEDVDSFAAGDIIWVPRKSDRRFWPVFLQTVTVAAQLASIYLIIDRASN